MLHNWTWNSVKLQAEQPEQSCLEPRGFYSDSAGSLVSTTEKNFRVSESEAKSADLEDSVEETPVPASGQEHSSVYQK